MDEERVRLALGQQFPQLDLGSVEPLGSGWEYDVYLVDGHLVVRFPRNADVASALDRAEALLDFVSSEVGPEVVVPKIILRGEPGPHFPHAFFGHELIAGTPASDIATPPSALAADLGHAVTHVHRVPADGARRLEVGAQKWDCRTAFAGLIEVLRTLPAVSKLVPEGAVWARNAKVPDEYSGVARFIHDDLQPEHLIVHEDSGRLSGIIDWGAALGDPAQDFSFIAAWGGWAFTEAVLDAYQGAVDVDFVNRVRFLGRVRALGWLAYEVQAGEDPRRTEGVVRDLLASNVLFLTSHCCSRGRNSGYAALVYGRAAQQNDETLESATEG